MKNSTFFLFVFLILGYDSWAQHEVTEKLDFERIIEKLLPQQEVEVDYNDLYDRLFTLYSNPLDLNKADRTDFQSLFFLSEKQISGILDHREEYGNFLSYFELLSIDGFNEEVVAQLTPFVTIDLSPRLPFKTSINHPENHELFIRYQTILEPKKGYSPPDTTNSGELTSRYSGGPSRLYARYLYSKKGYYSFGFTTEKDPGESITWNPDSKRYGMDYYSFHAMIENVSLLKRIIVGDFSMDYGQGLVFGSGIRIGKGMEPITTVRRNNLGLRPYRSVYENKDFSGVAVSAKAKYFEMNVFYSGVKRDAVLRRDTIDESDNYISYLQTIGLHRTISEIDAKHTTDDRSFGGNVNFKTGNNKLEVGLNGIYTEYSTALIPVRKKYNQFEFSGTDNHVTGGYVNYYLKNAHIFGEVAVSKSKGKAISAGVVASLSSQLQTSIHIRDYDKNFHSFHGKAFGENSRIENEKGIYWGMRILPVSHLELTTYMDFYSFPWLKYQVDAPSKGQDFMVAANYLANENLNLTLQYRNKTKEMNFTEGEFPLVQIVPKTTERFLLDVSYLMRSGFSTKTRIQHSNVSFNNKNTNGFILAQDISYKKSDFSISARYALFDTDDYDNRQFIYERDLLYVYSIPFFYNKGVRYYMVFKYDFVKQVSFWLKFAQTNYFNVANIGSGLEEIPGDTRSSISFQVRFRL